MEEADGGAESLEECGWGGASVGGESEGSGGVLGSGACEGSLSEEVARCREIGCE